MEKLRKSRKGEWIVKKMKTDDKVESMLHCEIIKGKDRVK